ncbi:MAG: glucose-1-phosphate adenylyltransferase [Pyrinomonadaceae bacterium]
MPDISRGLLAIVLGGGAGSRLFPLTLRRSKPAVPLAGKYRLIDIPISNCINSDITKIFVLTQYNSASLNRHISRTYRFSQFTDSFVEILAAEQTPESPLWFQGTADAVRQVLPHILDWDVDTVLILSGDHLYRMDYRDFLRRHYETNADLTISVVPCTPEAATDFGLLKTDHSGKIVEFSEKPKTEEALERMRVDTTDFGLTPEESRERPYLASMGIYVFKYDKMETLLKQNPEGVDFGREIIPAAIKSCNVQAYLFNDYWEDIGTIGAFYSANLDLTSSLPKFNVFDAQMPIYTRARYLPPSKLNNSETHNTIISEGCIIDGAYMLRSIIGLRARIESDVRIEESIIMGADFFQTIEEMKAEMEAGTPRIGIGTGSVIRRAIIDKNARIGSNVKLINEANLEIADDPEENYYIRDHIIIIPKNALIKDGTLI